MKSDQGVASTLVGAVPEAPRPPHAGLVSTAVGTEPSDTGVHATAEYLLEAGTEGSNFFWSGCRSALPR